jgi:hypothetical protein
MALSESSLASRITAEVEAKKGAPPDDPEQLQQMAQAIAKAIVDEIKANAVVTVSGVQSGGGSATGTIS